MRQRAGAFLFTQSCHAAITFALVKVLRRTFQEAPRFLEGWKWEFFLGGYFVDATTWNAPS
jgi:hypothetical protein